MIIKEIPYLFLTINIYIPGKQNAGGLIITCGVCNGSKAGLEGVELLQLDVLELESGGCITRS